MGVTVSKSRIGELHVASASERSVGPSYVFRTDIASSVVQTQSGRKGVCLTSWAASAGQRPHARYVRAALGSLTRYWIITRTLWVVVEGRTSCGQIKKKKEKGVTEEQNRAHQDRSLCEKFSIHADTQLDLHNLSNGNVDTQARTTFPESTA